MKKMNTANNTAATATMNNTGIYSGQTDNRTATVKRDSFIECHVRSILRNAGFRDYRITQDPKGRVTIYRIETTGKEKPILKYRPHKDGVVIFYPVRNRDIAATLNHKLTQHGYFGLEGSIDTDTAALYKAVSAVADKETATA